MYKYFKRSFNIIISDHFSYFMAEHIVTWAVLCLSPQRGLIKMPNLGKLDETLWRIFLTNVMLSNLLCYPISFVFSCYTDLAGYVPLVLCETFVSKI